MSSADPKGPAGRVLVTRGAPIIPQATRVRTTCSVDRHDSLEFERIEPGGGVEEFKFLCESNREGTNGEVVSVYLSREGLLETLAAVAEVAGYSVNFAAIHPQARGSK